MSESKTLVRKTVLAKEVRVGDLIKSFDLNLGSYAYKRVNEIFHTTLSPEEQRTIVLSNGDLLHVSHNTQVFERSSEKYKLASFLKVGDELLCSDGKPVEVINVTQNASTEKQFIDFNVESTHCFFVEGSLRGNSYLIHNSGAVTPSLDIWHIDIPDFLELQTENGDQRKKAYDIFPQIVISDEFMRRVKSDSDWTFFDPYEVKTKTGTDLAELWGDAFTNFYSTLESRDDLEITQKVNAKDLFKHIMRSQVETGMPYLAFKDTINQYNPNKHEGYIPAVNLCVESFSNVRAGEEAHTCNLVSINLANVSDEELPLVCTYSARILDNTIDLTTPPIHISKAHNDKYRTIGIGSMGFADWLALRGIPYMKSKEAASKLFEDIAYWTFKSSADLSIERGPFPAFPGSEWDKGLMLCHDLTWFKENAHSYERWESLQAQIAEHGIRNSHVQAIAPNTSSALVQGCTPSVLPIYSKFYFDKNAKGTVPICPPYIKGNFWVYQENKNIDQKTVVEVISTIQKWTDTGISMELIFNLNNPEVNAKYIYETLMSAWERGCKTVYYIRSIQKDGNINGKGEDCVSCAN